MTKLTISHVGKTYADGTEALRDIQVIAGSGEIVAILGGSGCGKTTLLRLIAGLDQPTEGRISLDDQVIAGTNPNVGAVFQEPRLLPWLSVADNIAFGGQRLTPGERRAAPPRCWTGSAWRGTESAGRAICPAASNSASPSPAL